MNDESRPAVSEYPVLANEDQFAHLIDGQQHDPTCSEKSPEGLTIKVKLNRRKLVLRFAELSRKDMDKLAFQAYVVHVQNQRIRPLCKEAGAEPESVQAAVNDWLDGGEWPVRETSRKLSPEQKAARAEKARLVRELEAVARKRGLDLATLVAKLEGQVEIPVE